MAELGLSGYPLVFLRLFKMTGFLILRLIFTIFQSLVWKWNGTSNRIRDSKRPENYDRCAHVVDVLLSFQFDISLPLSINDYIIIHNRFECPKYIFDKDHVSLITVDDKNAVFGVAPKPGMHLWRMEFNPFMKLAQFNHVRQLIVVPLNHFHQMAELLGEPEGQLIFLFNTARCGSTLLTQMMQTTGLCVAISEPDTFSPLVLRYTKEGDTEKLRQLTRDVVRWTCRPYNNFKPLAYMIKFKSSLVVYLRMFKETYPCSKYLFMYRDVVKVAQSRYRHSREMPLLIIKNTISRFRFSVDDYHRMKFSDDLGQSIIKVIASIKPYLDVRREGFRICAVRYEDLIGDRYYAAEVILKYCGLPTSMKEEFLKGMESDSQSNSIISRKILARHKVPPLTMESKRLANEFLKRNDLPTIEEGEDWILEGTITYKK